MPVFNGEEDMVKKKANREFSNGPRVTGNWEVNGGR